jgi:hypothetical protein
MILIANLFVCALLLMAVVALYFFVSLWMDRSNARDNQATDDWHCVACDTGFAADVQPTLKWVERQAEYVKLCPGFCRHRGRCKHCGQKWK